MPESRLAPSLLVTKSRPASVRAPAAMLAVVVLPFVPVTTAKPSVSRRPWLVR